MQRRTFLINGCWTTAASFLPVRWQAQQKNSTAPIPIIIDADTANEVDDLYAIAWALLEPRLNILGLTAAQWHTNPTVPADSVGASQQLNEEIIELLHRRNVPATLGSNVPMVNEQRPQPSAAATFIIEQAHAQPVGQKLEIAILGPATNVASAVLLDPTIVPKLSVNYLGFWYHPATNTWNKREFNTNNDPNAINALLNTPELAIRIMTASTSQHLVFEKSNMDALLKNRGGIGDYLLHRWDHYDRWWTQADPKKTKWTMWDVALLMAVAYPEHAKIIEVNTPHDNRLRTIGVFSEIDVAAMKNLFWRALDTHLKSR